MAGHHQGKVVRALAHVQFRLGDLRGREIRLDRQRRLHEVFRRGQVTGQHVERRHLHLDVRRTRQFHRQLAVGGQGAIAVAVGQLRLAQQVQQVRVAGMGHVQPARQVQRLHVLPGQQVLRHQADSRGEGRRIDGAGPFQPGGRFVHLVLARSQRGHGIHRFDTTLVGGQEGLQLLARVDQLACAHIHLCQVGGGREIRRLQHQRPGKAGARIGHVLPGQEHQAFQVLQRRVVLLRLLHLRYRVVRLVHIAQAELGAHQRHACLLRFRVQPGGHLQVVDGLRMLALAELAQGQRRAQVRGRRVERARLLEELAGLVVIARLHVGVADHGQQLRILARHFQGRLEHGQRIGHVAGAAQRRRQHLAGVDIVRIFLHVLPQVVLGLVVRTKAEVDRACQQQARHMVGRHLQDLEHRFVRGRVLALREVQQRLGVVHQHGARRDLHGGIDFGLRRLEFPHGDQQVGLFDVRRSVDRIDFYHVLIHGQRILLLALRTQQVALEQQGIGIGGIGRHRLVRQGVCPVRIAFEIGQAPAADQGGHERGLCLQYFVIQGARFFVLSQRQECIGAHAQHVGAVARRGRGGFVQHLLELALHEQRPA